MVIVVFVSCEIEILLNLSMTVIILVDTVVRNSKSSDFLSNFNIDFTSTDSRNSAVGVLARLLAARVTNRDSNYDSGSKRTNLLQSLQTSSGSHRASYFCQLFPQGLKQAHREDDRSVRPLLR